MIKEKRNQGVRLIFLLIYVGILFVINWLAFGTWLPLPGEKGLWFYSSAASIILGNLIVTPFYTKPVDALSYSVLAFIAIYIVNDLEAWGSIDIIVFYTALAFTGLVTIVSLITMATKDVVNPVFKKISRTGMTFSEYFGNQRVVFSMVFLFALIVFHRESAHEMFLLSITWATLVVIEPDKHLWNLSNAIKKIWINDLKIKEIGTISAYQIPRMILIRQHEDSKSEFGTLIAYKDSHAATKVGIVLNYVGRDETLLLRAIEIKISKDVKNVAEKFIEKISANEVVEFKYDQINRKNVKELDQIEEIVGIVDQDTTIERLQFEVINSQDLEEGRLVEVEISGKAVLYQILDGLTKEDIVVQKNKYGFARATAVKIGAWDGENKKFIPVKWLPEINSPVFLKQAVDHEPDALSVGHFPKTNYNVCIENINELATHNTAILGILGIGKSMLSIELVERLISNKTKVIVVDLTNQYAKLLPQFVDEKWSTECLNKIQEAGKKDADQFQDSPNEGGSVNYLSEAIEKDIYDFIHNEPNHYLKIFNPTQFFATKQLSDPKSYQEDGVWHRAASLWQLTPVEITSIITEATLKNLQNEMSDQARVCLVFEEAHSLVPEWSSAAEEGDKSATNRTARAILQGRKYGMGCLLITQRTANVTKTILNQCNSIFAMRTFDETGKNFLSNYIGAEYTNRLSSLEARQAVFYGKASSCENPVLIRLNDRDQFVEAFREKFPPQDLSRQEQIITENEISVEEQKDDIAKGNDILDSSISDDDLPF